MRARPKSRTVTNTTMMNPGRPPTLPRRALGLFGRKCARFLAATCPTKREGTFQPSEIELAKSEAVANDLSREGLSESCPVRVLGKGAKKDVPPGTTETLAFGLARRSAIASLGRTSRSSFVPPSLRCGAAFSLRARRSEGGILPMADKPGRIAI